MKSITGVMNRKPIDTDQLYIDGSVRKAMLTRCEEQGEHLIFDPGIGWGGIAVRGRDGRVHQVSIRRVAFMFVNPTDHVGVDEDGISTCGHPGDHRGNGFCVRHVAKQKEKRG